MLLIKILAPQKHNSEEGIIFFRVDEASDGEKILD